MCICALHHGNINEGNVTCELSIPVTTSLILLIRKAFSIACETVTEKIGENISLMLSTLSSRLRKKTQKIA